MWEWDTIKTIGRCYRTQISSSGDMRLISPFIARYLYHFGSMKAATLIIANSAPWDKTSKSLSPLQCSLGATDAIQVQEGRDGAAGNSLVTRRVWLADRCWPDSQTLPGLHAFLRVLGLIYGWSNCCRLSRRLHSFKTECFSPVNSTFG